MLARCFGVMALTVVLIGCSGKSSTAPDDIPNAALAVISIDSVATLGGRNVDVNIRLQYPGDPAQTLAELGGLDLLMFFNGTALTFQDVKKGPALSEWEYFTWRTGMFGGSVATGQFRLVAMRDMNNGLEPNPSQFYPDGIIATATFYVSADQELTETCAPVGFSLQDCNDNILLSKTNDTAYFPMPNAATIDVGETYDPTACSLSFEYQSVHPEILKETIELRPGKVCILMPPDDRFGERGDLNLNAVAFEEADCLLLERYLLEGPNVWDPYFRPFQIAAGDCNGDGDPLTVADYEFCSRVIRGEARVEDSLPEPFEVDASFWIRRVDSVWYGYLGPSGTSVSALWFEVEDPSGGSITVAHAWDIDFPMEVRQDGNVTRVLIADWEQGIVAPGDPSRPILELRSTDSAAPAMRLIQASRAPGVALNVLYSILIWP